MRGPGLPAFARCMLPCAVAITLLLAPWQADAQDGALPTVGADAANAAAPVDSASDAAELTEDFVLSEDFELPEDFQAVAVYDVPSEDETPDSAALAGDVDEITVIGVRRRRNIADIQQQIKAKTEEFFDLFNELVVDDNYKIKCTWMGGRGGLKTRVCMAGYQMREMKDRQFFGQAGVYRRPPREYLQARQEIYTDTVAAALRELPALMMLAEEITALKEEESRLNGEARLLERQAEHLRQRELLGPEVIRVARRDRPGRQRP